ncbi:hypothetical protein Pmani_023899 [Petrolisthes manimaculis]|uniref:Uncharacterized protein n=1 Tax=Petrolisthes manimaculis TaxID=1843537 RepID=A0AAE1PBB9_9EUCA|nr:hypothetical protein Pmani_023899 [Petrolisthes manimaculis]
MELKEVVIVVEFVVILREPFILTIASKHTLGDLLSIRRSPVTLQDKTEAETFKQPRTTIPRARNTIQRVRMKGKHRVYAGLPTVLSQDCRNRGWKSMHTGDTHGVG